MFEKMVRHGILIAVATLIVNVLAVATSIFALQVYDRVVPTLAYATLSALVGILVVARWENENDASKSASMHPTKSPVVSPKIDSFPTLAPTRQVSHTFREAHDFDGDKNSHGNDKEVDTCLNERTVV